MTDREKGGVAKFELARARLGFAAAILHTIDLNGLARIHAQIASPQGLLDGFGLAEQTSAEQWLAGIEAAKALKEATRFEADVLESVVALLPEPLRYGEEGTQAS